WSSDVCSSDLCPRARGHRPAVVGSVGPAGPENRSGGRPGCPGAALAAEDLLGPLGVIDERVAVLLELLVDDVVALALEVVDGVGVVPFEQDRLASHERLLA